MEIEKRKQFRKILDASIKITLEKGCYLSTTAYDISVSGLSFITPNNSLKNGQTVKIKFSIPLNGIPRTIDGKAQVVHIERMGHYNKIGLVFTNLEELSNLVIHAYAGHI